MSKKLGVKVDLVMKDTLKPRIKDRVKQRSFNLPLLAKPYEPISSIRLSFGIVPFLAILEK